MNTVFVASSAGWVQHGPVRKSEAQASSVARALARRLGWVAVAAPASGPAGACPETALAPSLAGLSPVWRDPDLAARWAASGAGRVARSASASAPAPAPAPAPGAAGDVVARLARLGLVLGVR